MTEPLPPAHPAQGPAPRFPGVAAVVLAAGASVRFGPPKLLHPVGGVPLLLRSVGAFLDAGVVEVVVVVGAHAARYAELLRSLPVRTLVHPGWEAGMFSSARAGLAAASPSATHVALSPADLPGLGPADVAAVVSAALAGPEGAVAVPLHAGRRGHPLVLPRAVADEVASWPDGARLDLVLREEGRRVLEVPVDHAGVLRDVDTPSDLVEAPGASR